ncbi:branched-chain amino acid ABC transporter permease [Azospirillum sp. 412522]|nr:branched-chain amino acid ABC transporter permease [Azospirillum sp. 412522]MBY6264460.1 branched-chain amino acid ABC transporter permease [Azospirillum sp. 412522]
MQTAFQIIATGLQIGAIYVLFSLGLTLTFGIMRIVNFAHGQFFTLSALVVAVVMPYLASAGLPLPAAFAGSAAAGIAASLLLGLVTYQWGFRRLQHDFVGSFILSLGLILLLEGLYLEVFGGAVRSVPPIIDGTVSVFGASLTTQRLLLCFVAMVLTGLLYAALALTPMGKALRAASIDHEAAMLQGIPYQRIARHGFMIATLLAAVAGALIAPVSVVTTTLGSDYLIKGFIAVIVGGLGSIPGAIIGSLFIALVESVGGYFFDPSRASIAIFALVMVVLLVRPQGLMGHG